MKTSHEVHVNGQRVARWHATRTEPIDEPDRAFEQRCSEIASKATIRARIEKRKTPGAIVHVVKDTEYTEAEKAFLDRRNTNGEA